VKSDWSDLPIVQVDYVDDGEDHVTVRLVPAHWVMTAVALLIGVALGGSGLGTIALAGLVFLAGYLTGRAA